MINYNLIIICLKIFQALSIAMLVILSYKPSKDAVIETINEVMEEFHSNYIQNNYHLKLANLSSLDNIREAIVLIKEDRDFFDRIPDGDIIFVNMAINLLDNYSLKQKRIFLSIFFAASIEVAIGVGLSFI